MRRLGFLEILICDCASSNRLTQETLGSKLWNLVAGKQDKWLTKLGIMRGLESVEVGRITGKIAGRLVKLATDLGLLTEGPFKALTDLGRLFKLFRREQFFIGLNLGQQIILTREFLREDALIFPRLIEFIVESKSSSLQNVYGWFVNTFIKNTLAQRSENLDTQLIQRFSSTMSSYNSEGPKIKQRGHDKVKHMVIPRLGNIVDLQIISKKAGPIYMSTDKTVAICQDFCKPLIQGSELTDDEIFYSLAKIHNVSERAGMSDVLKKTLLGFDTLAEPPLKVVPTKVLRDFVSINSIVSGKSVILPGDVEEIENFLSKKFYGKVIFFEDMKGHISHISITDEVKEKIFAKFEEYVAQIGE